MSNKVFISHAAKDSELIDAFYNFLHDGMGISDIFCSSKKGSLGIGEDFINRIREELRGCEAVIFLITPEYLKSPFCLIEMGAAWALGKYVKPVLVPPLTFGDLCKPLERTQAVMINDLEGLDTLYKELGKLNITTASSLHFVDALKRFLPSCGILTPDEKGVYRAVITEIYRVPKGDAYYYKIKGKISVEDLKKGRNTEKLDRWDVEQQWISARFVKVENLRVGDILEFELDGGDFMEGVKHGGKLLTDVRNLYYKNPRILM
ncbi:MAG: toll/interleukin-1 receptor domain-containing protein [Hungatella hathewayi]|nr:toll/interleukin-1 receptor domain-containing protein [Hungatella hathewayi]